MRLEREERGSTFQSELATRGSQLAQALAQTRQPQPLLEIEPAPPAEQIAIAPGIEQLGNRHFERSAAVVQEPARERRLGSLQLRLRRPLLRTRKAKMRAARDGQSSDLGCVSAERPAAE